MATIFFAGLVLGSIYALVALGFDLAVLGTGGFNFAQGGVVIVGTFVSYQFGSQQHLPIVVVILIAAAFGAVVNLLVERFALRPVVGRGTHGELVTTIGASTIILGLVALKYNKNTYPTSNVISSRLVTIANGRVAVDSLVIVGVAFVATAGLWAWSHYTIGGLACLAANEDRSAAALRGINVGRLSILTMVVAGALGGACGPIVATQTLAVLAVSQALTIKGFMALTIGGFGSFPGSAIGGVVVGLTEAFAARYLGGGNELLVLFALLLIVLFVVPSGIFGRRSERAV